MKSVASRFSLLALALIVLPPCSLGKRNQPAPDPKFTTLGNIVIIPMVDDRAVKIPDIDLEKLRKFVEKILKAKNYSVSKAESAGEEGEITQAELSSPSPEWILGLGPPDARWVLVIGIRQTTGSKLALNSAETFGFLFDKANTSTVWSGTGVGHPDWVGPAGLGPYPANQAAADSMTNLVMLLTGQEKHDVLVGAMANLVSSIPKLPKEMENRDLSIASSVAQGKQNVNTALPAGGGTISAALQNAQASHLDDFTIQLHDPNTAIRTLAAWELGNLRDPRAVEPLRSALNDLDPSVRQRAGEALGKIYFPNAAVASNPERGETEPDSGHVPRNYTPSNQPAMKPEDLAVARQADALYAENHFADAAPLYDQLCASGVSGGCSRLGAMYESGRGVTIDPSRAAALYTKGCDANFVPACVNLGRLYTLGNGVAKDDSKAAALYSKACDKGVGTACGRLGFMYEEGQGVEKDDSRAADLNSRGCNAGFAAGCTNLGRMYEQGRGVAMDYTHASSLFSKACDLGDVTGCGNLGFLYASGRGVAADNSRAVALYSKACENGASHFCSNLGTMYANGLGAAKDDSRAQTLYTKACDAGDAIGCSNLGNCYRLGIGIYKDPDKARQLLTKGCKLGNQWGCDRLKEIQ